MAVTTENEVEQAAPKPTSPKSGPSPKHSAVIYVHGMGSQRRYEETCRLIDKIDGYLFQQFQRGISLGMLKAIKVRVEPFRGEPDAREIIGFIRTRLVAGSTKGVVDEAESDDAAKKDKPSGREVRFYEVYWAPMMSEAKSAFGVGRWVLKQAFRPWKTLLSSWRDRQRLRRASLVALFHRGRSRPTAADQSDYSELLKLYDLFENLRIQRKYRRGTFGELLTFIAEHFDGKPEKTLRIQNLAKTWRCALLIEEARNAFTLTTVILTLSMLAAAVLASVFGALQSLLGWAPLSTAVQWTGLPFSADFRTAATIAVSLASLLGLGKFLTDYLGDVEVWSTYEETDVKNVIRNRVLDETIATFRHVLEDDNCERVTIVAHSLGTSIAHDALLALARRNRAHYPTDPISCPTRLNKIEHFITMGSPIDKIEYFFESYSSKSHRYKRVVEDLRGDIESAPLSRNGHPYVHWINFWDIGDPFSGALDSPAGTRSLRRSGFCQRVDNVHVASFSFPRPGASHAGYFDHQIVISTLFNVIYHRDLSFRPLNPTGISKPPDYECVFQGPGESLGIWRLVYLFTGAAIPWLTLLGLVALAVGLRVVCFAAGAAASAGTFVLLLGFVASRVRGHRNPL